MYHSFYEKQERKITCQAYNLKPFSIPLQYYNKILWFNDVKENVKVQNLEIF